MQRQSPNKSHLPAVCRAGKKKIVVGLTGSFGSGKSTVAGVLKAQGAQIIDADQIAHSCIRRGKAAYRKIIHTFGNSILQKNKEIDRPRLAGMVFNNKILLNRLNSIIHPEVKSIISRRIRISKARVIVLDAPLLLEAGLKKIVDKLIVVTINKAEQARRLVEKTRLSRREISARIKSQIPLREKARLADFIIDNSGSRRETKKQVKAIWEKLD